MSSSLSIKKIQKLLLKNSIFPDRYFIFEGNCRFVECIVALSGIRFLIYIRPSDFKLPVSPSEITYDLKELELPTKTTTSHQPLDIAERYTSIIPPSIESKEDLQNNYRIDISNTGTEELVHALNDINAQVERLNYMVESSKFQFGILYDHYLFARGYVYNIVDGSSQLNTNQTRRLLPIVDINDLVNEMTTLPTTLMNLKIGVYRVLALNYDKHIVVMNNLVNKTASLLTVLTEVKNKRDRFMTYRNTIIETTAANIDNPNFSEDDRGTCLEDMINLDELLDNSTLGIDTIFFDNILAFTQVLRNVEMLLHTSQ